MTQITEAEISAGQAIYSKLLLKIYDVWVISISNSWIWRSPKKYQIEQFNRFASDNHLDIGVGTGYYLKNKKWSPSAQLSLMDLNPNCLATSQKAIAKLNPTVIQADIFKPQPKLANHFDSISMNYLLHCLPGDMSIKSQAIGNAVAMLKPGGVLFGATIVSNPELHTKVSTKLSAIYNKKGIFSNLNDTVDTLKTALSQHLEQTDVKVIGCVALFKGEKLETTA